VIEPPALPPIQLWVEPVLPEGWPRDGFGPLAALTSQIPMAESLPGGTWVAVRPSRAPLKIGLLARLFQKPPGAHLALRCTALLARGYEHVGGGLDDRGQPVAWGCAPASTNEPA